MANFSLSLNWSQTFSAMRHRNFRLYFWGQLVSVVGIWMQITAQQWLVYRITGSQASLGMVTFINFLPVLLFSLFMGVVTDQFPRRKLLVFTQVWFMLLACILALLTWLELVQYWHILLLAFLLGYWLRFESPLVGLLWDLSKGVPPNVHYVVAAGATALTWMAVFHSFGLYRFRLRWEGFFYDKDATGNDRNDRNAS